MNTQIKKSQTIPRHWTMSSKSSSVRCGRRSTASLIGVANALFIYYTITSLVSSTSNNNSPTNPKTQQQQQLFKLDCQPGELRHFNYESATKVWGSDSQEVRLRGTLRLQCMEPGDNATIKYLAEVMSLTPSFGDNNLDQVNSKQTSSKRESKSSIGKQLKTLNSINSKLYHIKHNEQLFSESDQKNVKAEPVFEEVAETADKVRKTVSGWFSKTWGSVKDFFSNIFTSSERSSVSREQAFKETGLDIGNQCKGSGSGGKNNLPIDDSVFEDLEPKYYVSATSLETLASSGTGYDFDDNNGNDNKASDFDDEDSSLSFFDDPKVARRSKRSVSETSVKHNIKVGQTESYEKLLKVPFIFIQSKNGKILEIKFSNLEIDTSIKNFKRHLSDLFATNLDKNKSQTSEVSSLGKHTTQYLVDTSNNSSAIKESLERVGKEQPGQSKQLIRALAVVADMKQQQMIEDEDNDVRLPPNKPIESRDHSTTNGAVSSEVNVSVLRTINSTNKIYVSAKTIAADIDKIQVQIKQVQQISDGRMVGTAGQLGMSLLQKGKVIFSAPNRVKREAEVEDISELLQVSSSFSIQLVPLNKLGNFAGILSNFRQDNDNNNNVVSEQTRGRRSLSQSSESELKSDLKSEPAVKLAESNSEKLATKVEVNQSSGKTESSKNSSSVVANVGKKNLTKKTPSNGLVSKPKDDELEKVLVDLKELESQLQVTSSSLQAESSADEPQVLRLEVLRDQIQMRLNEEFMRNRMRHSNTARQMAAPSSLAKTADLSEESMVKVNDLGLSLTQLILDTGITSKRKGSVYSTLEEIIQLEMSLNGESQKGAISKLLRDTRRVDRLRGYCKSAIASIDEIQAQSARLELKNPFNVDDDEIDNNDTENLITAKLISATLAKNRKRLDQCKQVAQLLLRANDKQAIDMVIDLMDECDSRMLASVKHEELGYGRISRYYRNLRQQFTELLASVSKPNDALVDRLMQRLRLDDRLTKPSSISNNKLAVIDKRPELEFTYVPSGNSIKKNTTNRNSILKEDEEVNNNEAFGSLVMIVTELAASDSVSKSKKADVADRLLTTLKASTCSLFRGPDLDILESMANFKEPIEELVGKVVHLARRCRNQDQYLVACVHSLQGQLRHPTAQRFLADSLKSYNVSCTLKSEIVFTLLNAIMQDELKKPSELKVRNWPTIGINKVDQVLLDLVDKSNTNKRHADQRCLSQLVAYYISRKLNADGTTMANSELKTTPRMRQRRAVVNDNDFWDEATCKRWVLPPENSNSSLNSPPNYELNDNYDEANDIDDNLIFNSMTTNNNKRISRKQTNLKLVERESITNTTNGEPPISQIIRKRHKCTASKVYGPKSAQAQLKAEIVNDLVGANDENKFLARFRLTANFLGNKLDVGRMYLWHQRRMTRAHVNILGKSLWDTAHSCTEKAPNNLLYMPLFDFNLWLVKVSVGLKVQSEMGFFSNCNKQDELRDAKSWGQLESKKPKEDSGLAQNSLDELELFPSISLRASGEATAKFVFAKAGMSLASQYGYQGNIKVSKQPESCMSIYSAHQPMNVTFSSWFQLWDSDCHYWGSRNKAEPMATRWRLVAKKPTAWLEDECLTNPGSAGNISHLANNTLVGVRSQGIRP